ncbi:MAG: SDR family oxidoreductase [Clostridiales bacterium]|jgi:3-oxoacyl-[acyl-carrier protein] reductase|nr:SDR family oxidoreductase [Clostridiales bacterium]
MTKKTVLITGASRGIGAELARVFAQGGYNVVINYFKNKELAEALLRKITEGGGTAEIFPCDIADSQAVNEMVGFTLKRFGRLDVLINNAGISSSGLITDMSDAEWKRLIDVNLSGVFYGTRAVLPRMISEKSGVIINISSIWGIAGASCEVAYSAAKAAVIGFTKALAKEVGLSGVRVNCIAPGVIETDMLNGFTPTDLNALKEQTALDRLGTPADIAQTALFLASDGASYITGQIIAVDGGISF